MMILMTGPHRLHCEHIIILILITDDNNNNNAAHRLHCEHIRILIRITDDNNNNNAARAPLCHNRAEPSGRDQLDCMPCCLRRAHTNPVNPSSNKHELRHPDVLSGRSAPPIGRCRMKTPPPAVFYTVDGCVEGAP
jgi:hypothetical protein